MMRCLALAALFLAGCAPRADVPLRAGAVAGLRERCPPGTFMGTMTTNCPEIVR